MAQKANSISLRLQYTNRYFDNSWYSKKFYDKLVAKDISVEKYTNTFLKLLKLPLGRFSIQHLPKKTRLFCFFCYPKISRTLRSKVFGVYLPHFLRHSGNRTRKKNFKISQNKSVQQYDSLKKPKTQNFTKYLYNRNFLAHPHLVKNPWSSLMKSNFQESSGLFGKQEKWSKNHFFLDNCFRYTKSNKFGFDFEKKSLQLFSKIKTGEKNTKKIQKDLKVTFNETFLKFLLSLIIQNKVKKHYSLKSAWSKKNPLKNRRGELKDFIGNKGHLLKRNNDKQHNLKNFRLNTIQPGIVLKYFLILTDFQKNLYNTPGLLSGVSGTIKNQSNFKKLGLLNTKLIDYLHSHSKKSISSFSFLTSSKSTPSSKLGTRKKTFLEQLQTHSNFDKDFYSIYNSHLEETFRILNISNSWKLENIENKRKYKNYIQRSLSGLYNLDLEFIPFRVKNDWQSAGFFADEIVYFLERRVPFRRLKNKLLKYISKNSTIRGVRITCSGRAGGKSKKAQRAKTECVKLGQTSLHVFSNKIDFASRTAQTSFGSVGIKVWISYN